MAFKEKLELTTSWANEMAIIESWIRPRIDSAGTLQILEAGCGQKWDLDLGATGYFLTGVDLDAAALKLRVEVSKDLHRAIVGDLRTVEIKSGSFDVIYNSFVLEHVPGAEQVLENFTRWLKPGGLLVIRIPDPYSVHGYMSRVTPHWFHVFFYRHVMGAVNAGMHGYAPYPVHYDGVVSQDGIRDFCNRNGLCLVSLYGTGGYFRPGKGLLKLGIPIFKRLVSLVSLGRLSSSHNDLLYLIKKND